jgi:hypothetical protein
MAPRERREAAKQYVTEVHLQEQGARYNYDGQPPVDQSNGNGHGQTSYTRT